MAPILYVVLERSTIDTFIKDMNQTVESLATTISPELNRKDNVDDEEVNANIKRFIENSATSDIIEIRVVDEKGSSEEQLMSMNKALWERK